MNSKIMALIGVIVVLGIVWFLVFGVGTTSQITINELEKICEKYSFDLQSMNGLEKLEKTELIQFKNELSSLKERIQKSESSEKNELISVNNLLLEKIVLMNLILEIEEKENEISAGNECNALNEYQKIASAMDLILPAIDRINTSIELLNLKYPNFIQEHSINLEKLDKEKYLYEINEKKEVIKLITLECSESDVE
ncbi:MAG: hypothetical protein ABIA76_01600 [Candidatus Diapherotrites archaeon]